MKPKRLVSLAIFVVLPLLTCLIVGYFFYGQFLTFYYSLPSPSSPVIDGKRIVEFDQDFILRKSEVASIKNTDVSLKITKFINSPCPKDVYCFWSGLDVYYELTVNGTSYAHPGNRNDAPYDVWMKQSDYTTYAKFIIERKK